MDSKIFSVVNKVNEFAGQSIEASKVIEGIHYDLESLKSFKELNSKLLKKKSIPNWFKETSHGMFFNNKAETKVLIQLIILDNIFQHSPMHNLFDHLDTYRILNNSFKGFGISDDKLYSTIFLVKSLSGNDKYHLWRRTKLFGPDKENRVIYISDLLYGENITVYLNIHEYQGMRYFNKENFETLLNWLLPLSISTYFRSKKISEKTFLDRLKTHYSFFEELKEKAGKSSYNIVKFKELLLGKNGKTKVAGKPVKKNAVKKKVVKRQV